MRRTRKGRIVVAPKKKMDYQALDTEMQKQILTERIKQVEAEHFNQVTNLAIIRGQTFAPGQEQEREGILKATEKAIEDLGRAHATLAEQLADL